MDADLLRTIAAQTDPHWAHQLAKDAFQKAQEDAARTDGPAMNNAPAKTRVAETPSGQVPEGIEQPPQAAPPAIDPLQTMSADEAWDLVGENPLRRARAA